MKIALLSDCYPPRLGGIETQVRDLGRQLAAAGHEVHVYTATPDSRPRLRLRNVTVAADSGVTVHRVTLPIPFALPVNPVAPSIIRDELRTFDVAHVHMGVVSPFATDMANLALDLAVPTAITWHCVLGEAAIAAHRRLGTAARWRARGAALSGVSRMAGRLVGRAARVDERVGGDAIAVLPNGIDAASWRLDGMPPARDTGRVRVVAAMRFAPRKRVHALLAMLDEVHDADPDRVEATVYGDGPLLAPARLRPSSRDRGWLHLPGRVTRPALAAAYAAADVYLAPTRMEAFGIAALEARTAGLAVVAIGSSGVADFITHDVNGLLAEDDAGLVAATRRLVADDALRQRIRAHNLATPPAEDWSHIVECVLAEYRRAGATR